MPSWASSIEVHMGGKRQDMDNMRSSVSMRVRVCARVCVCVRERVRGGRRPTKARKVFCPPRTTEYCICVWAYYSISHSICHCISKNEGKRANESLM